MALNIVHLVTALSLVYTLCTWVTADFFTAVTELEVLLKTHKKIIDDLQVYIDKEEKRLLTLKKQLDYYKREHYKAMEDIPNYLGNPINDFTLIKRLTVDLDYIEHSIQFSTEYVKNISMSHEDVNNPTRKDLVGAAQALARLQDIYQLEVKELSAGILNGVLYSSPISAGDCFEIGRSLYNQTEYEYCIAWMTEALDKYREESDMYPFNEAEAIKYIGFSHYKLGDVKSALDWTRKVLELEPNHSQARANVTHYEKELLEQELETGEDSEAKGLEKPHSPYLKKDNYKALCRGETVIAVEISKRLKCWYVTENHPFLRLAPLKVEQLYIEPNIFVFHQVISDDEIEFLKENAKPRFKRSKIVASHNGTLGSDNYRISKTASLHDSTSVVVERISQRMADMTGLNMDSAEDLQVVNYGIGGHYGPHQDYYQKYEEAFGVNAGNRIATVLFYMSDVAQGGATVFTKLGLSVFPQKHTALFWMNLHPSGKGDTATCHAACPVLRGSKWICNKWIHQGGQELIKPCNIDCLQEETARKIPRPVHKSN